MPALCIADGVIQTVVIMNTQILSGKFIRTKVANSWCNRANPRRYPYRKQALQAKVEADKEGIVVPLTLEEYCLKPKTNPNNQEPQVRPYAKLSTESHLTSSHFQLDMTDFYDDDAYDCSESDSESMHDGEGEDSGNAE